jgi:hypothetical protein
VRKGPAAHYSAPNKRFGKQFETHKTRINLQIQHFQKTAIQLGLSVINEKLQKIANINVSPHSMAA